jgi:hypothetical protein
MHTTCGISIWKVTILFVLASLTARNGAAQASAYASVYSFKGGPDGASPNGLTVVRTDRSTAQRRPEVQTIVRAI